MIEINTNELDIMDPCVDSLTEEQENALLAREQLRECIVMRMNPPCECMTPGCGNFIDDGDLFQRIGASGQTIICIECDKDLQ